VDGTISSLAAALSPRKLVFFVIGWAVTMLLCFLLLQLDVCLTTLIIAVVLALGLSAVVAGGIARMAHTNLGLGDAFTYCMKKFFSFFLAGLLVPLALLIVSAILNGLMYLISSETSAGSYVAAVFFGPQFLINLLLVVAGLVTVIVPCAIVVEETGVFQAVGRLLFCIRRQTGTVMTQVALGVFFAGMITMILTVLTFSALMPTASTNGGAVSGLGASSFLPSFTASPRSGSPSRNSYNFNSFSSRSGSRSGSPRSPFGLDLDDDSNSLLAGGSFSVSGSMWIRAIWMLIILAAVFSYPAVYWIVSFTNFYKALLPSLPAAAIPPPPPPAA